MPPSADHRQYGMPGWIPYTDRVSFGAAVAALGPVTETWDDNATDTVIPDRGTLDGITYDFSGGEGLVTDNSLPLSFPNGLGKVDPGFFVGGESLTFSFASPIVAFGININTFATAPGSYGIMTDLLDAALSGFDPFPGFGTGQFVGLTLDTPFTSVTFANPSDFTYTLDDLTYASASAVPEPATLVLLGSGLFGMAACVRRRRRSTRCSDAAAAAELSRPGSH